MNNESVLTNYITQSTYNLQLNKMAKVQETKQYTQQKYKLHPNIYMYSFEII